MFHIAPQIIEPEFAAILGHSSAHSFATGPVTADPFISPLTFTITPALSISKARYQHLKIKIEICDRMAIIWLISYPQSRDSSPPFF